MKKQDFIQIKGLDEKALSLKSAELKDEIANLLVDKNMNKLKDLKSIAKKRKDLAQVLTVLRQKQMLEALEKNKKGEISEEWTHIGGPSTRSARSG